MTPTGLLQHETSQVQRLGRIWQLVKQRAHPKVRGRPKANCGEQGKANRDEARSTTLHQRTRIVRSALVFEAFAPKNGSYLWCPYGTLFKCQRPSRRGDPRQVAESSGTALEGLPTRLATEGKEMVPDVREGVRTTVQGYPRTEV